MPKSYICSPHKLTRYIKHILPFKSTTTKWMFSLTGIFSVGLGFLKLSFWMDCLTNKRILENLKCKCNKAKILSEKSLCTADEIHNHISSAEAFHAQTIPKKKKKRREKNYYTLLTHICLEHRNLLVFGAQLLFQNCDMVQSLLMLTMHCLLLQPQTRKLPLTLS